MLLAAIAIDAVTPRPIKAIIRTNSTRSLPSSDARRFLRCNTCLRIGHVMKVLSAFGFVQSRVGARDNGLSTLLDAGRSTWWHTSPPRLKSDETRIRSPGPVCNMPSVLF